MDRVDAVLRDARWAPRWGWHEDHRQWDRTTEYLPALQQVRSEFEALAVALNTAGLLGGRCLQLGVGECFASHAVWGCLFGRVATMDWSALLDGPVEQPGRDTHSPDAQRWAANRAPFDFLFIDAGHLIEDIERDHRAYGPMVRSGGIIAFHDALRRPGYGEEVEVWKYLERIQGVTVAGSEVGVAWITKA